MSTGDAAKFAEVARGLTEESGLDETVHRVIDYANELTEGDDSGIALVRAEKRLEAAGSSGDQADQADRLQERLGEGPGVNAAKTHQTYLIRDVANDSRWPRWGPLVAELGVKSVISTSLHTSRRTIGTLNIYSTDPDGLSEEDAEAAEVLGSHAAVALDCVNEESGLHRAIETRNLIGQAQGLLMAQYGLDARRAFEMLRERSQQTNTKLRVVAEQLVHEHGDGA